MADLLKLCRLCFESMDDGVDLFKRPRHSSHAAALGVVLHITLEQKSMWPSSACSQCIDFIRQIKTFRDMVNSTQELLFNTMAEELPPSEYSVVMDQGRSSITQTQSSQSKEGNVPPIDTHAIRESESEKKDQEEENGLDIEQQGDIHPEDLAQEDPGLLDEVFPEIPVITHTDRREYGNCEKAVSTETSCKIGPESDTHTPIGSNQEPELVKSKEDAVVQPRKRRRQLKRHAVHANTDLDTLETPVINQTEMSDESHQKEPEEEVVVQPKKRGRPRKHNVVPVNKNVTDHPAIEHTEINENCESTVSVATKSQEDGSIPEPLDANVNEDLKQIYPLKLSRDTEDCHKNSELEHSEEEEEVSVKSLKRPRLPASNLDDSEEEVSPQPKKRGRPPKPKLSFVDVDAVSDEDEILENTMSIYSAEESFLMNLEAPMDEPDPTYISPAEQKEANRKAGQTERGHKAWRTIWTKRYKKFAHLEPILKNMNLTTCSTCKAVFDTFPLMEEHYNEEHKVRPRAKAHVMCCGVKLNFRNIYEHVMYHEDPDAWKCKACGLQCIHKLDLEDHELIHQVQSSSTFSCKKCGKIFKSELYHKNHQLKCAVCAHCNTKSTNQEKLDKHVEKNHTLTPCEFCGIVFKGTILLNLHVKKLHAKQKQLTECDECGKHFRDIENHKQKMHSDTKQRRPCPICFKLLAPRAMRVHLKGVHGVGAQALPCKHCDKTFLSTAQLIRHEAIHEGVRYKCNFCDETFGNIANRFTHHQEKHAEEYTVYLQEKSHTTKLKCLYDPANIVKVTSDINAPFPL